MLFKALLLPITGPISGLCWIGEQIQERVDTEFDAQENLHKQLLSLQLRFDLGDISEEDFEIEEEELLLKIQALEEEDSLNQEEFLEEEDSLNQEEFLEEENSLNQEEFIKDEDLALV